MNLPPRWIVRNLALGAIIALVFIAVRAVIWLTGNGPLWPA